MMKKSISIIVILISYLDFNSYAWFVDVKNHANLKNTKINGIVTQTLSHCGGVPPSEEELKALSTPSPYANKKFYVRNGKKNLLKEKIILSFTTDNNGNFSFELPIGIYSIIQEWQLKEFKINQYADKNHIVDRECLKKRWGSPYYLLEIKNETSITLNFTFHHDCFLIEDIPCITYSGPYPP